jgi:hypothetical protein
MDLSLDPDDGSDDAGEHEAKDELGLERAHVHLAIIALPEGRSDQSAPTSGTMTR